VGALRLPEQLQLSHATEDFQTEILRCQCALEASLRHSRVTRMGCGLSWLRDILVALKAAHANLSARLEELDLRRDQSTTRSTKSFF
jgi:hypothetical protein